MSWLHADDLVEVARGRVDRKWIHNRHGRDQWLTPTPSHPGRGKAYRYDFEHAMEVALIAALLDTGLSHEVANRVIHDRLERAAQEGDEGGGAWEADVRQSIRTLPEFQPNSDKRYWVIGWGLRPQGGEPYVQGLWVAGEHETITGLSRGAANLTIIDVAAAVRIVRARMATVVAPDEAEQ